MRNGRRCGILRGGLLPAAIALTPALAGCLHTGWGDKTERRRESIEALVAPVLAMDPRINWTKQYNELLEIGPPVIQYLMGLPAIQRVPEEEDALAPMQIYSLVLRLAAPREVPNPGFSCYQITSSLFYFELRLGESVPELLQPEPIRIERGWSHLLAPTARKPVAVDFRDPSVWQPLWNWWARKKLAVGSIPMGRRLNPDPDELPKLLRRRIANEVSYHYPAGVARQCDTSAGTVRPKALFTRRTYDYNMIRSACAVLGQTGRYDVETELLRLYTFGDKVEAANALLALGYCENPEVPEMVRFLEDLKDRRRQRSRTRRCCAGRSKGAEEQWTLALSFPRLTGRTCWKSVCAR